jgi:hypothetical protein
MRISLTPGLLVLCLERFVLGRLFSNPVIMSLLVKFNEYEKGGGERYLRTNKASNSFLGRTDGLVPGAFGAVGVVLCDCSRGGSGVVADFGGCVGGFVLELGFVFLGFAGVLGFVSM